MSFILLCSSLQHRRTLQRGKPLHYHRILRASICHYLIPWLKHNNSNYISPTTKLTQLPAAVTMFKHNLLRQLSRTSTTAARPPTLHRAAPALRSSFTTSQSRLEKQDDPEDYSHYTTAGEPGAFKHEGQHSRTDNRIRVEYPEEADLPRQQPVQGRGGFHFKRTLASFSLEDRVGVVTGGARGLGLVMSQALVVSGADVAIVDLNSTSLTPSEI